jgi:hypothetical protein
MKFGAEFKAHVKTMAAGEPPGSRGKLGIYDV